MSVIAWSTHLITVPGQLTNVRHMVFSDWFQIGENVGLWTHMSGLTVGPFGGVIVLTLFHVLERLYLHITVQWHNLQLLKQNSRK